MSLRVASVSIRISEEHSSPAFNAYFFAPGLPSIRNALNDETENPMPIREVNSGKNTYGFGWLMTSLD